MTAFDDMSCLNFPYGPKCKKQTSKFSVKRDLRCGSNTPLTQNGGEIISHAGYEFGHHYGKNLNCSWTIMAPAGHYVELLAENFTVNGG